MDGRLGAQGGEGDTCEEIKIQIQRDYLGESDTKAGDWFRLQSRREREYVCMQCGDGRTTQK